MGALLASTGVNARSATAGRSHLTPATGVFLWTRVATWALAALAFAWYPKVSGAAKASGYGTSLWNRWDSGWFLRIAEHGYGTDRTQAPAFFPLYPWLTGVLGRVLGHHFELAALLVSLAACFVAFELLWRLAAIRLGTDDATRTVLYLALFPMALFLQADYSESLFLACAVGAFYAAERGSFAWAAVAASGALLTRSVGIAVVAGLAVMALPELRRLAWLVLPFVTFIAFPVALHFQAGDAWAFIHTQDAWERTLSPEGPFGGIWDGFAVLGHTTDNFSHAHFLAVNIEDLVALLFFLCLLPLVWSWFGAAYGVFATVSLALPLSFPAGTGDFPLISMPRFGVLIFPFFLVLATAGRNPRTHTAIVALSALGLGVAITQWATFQWVA